MLKKIVILSLLYSTSVLFSSCVNFPIVAVTTRTPESKNFNVKPDKSRIYIYANENFAGAIKVSVSIDGNLIGQIIPKTFFNIEVEPGMHVVTCFAETTSQISINIKPGDSAFVKEELKIGAFKAKCSLRELDQVIGQKELLHAKQL